MKIVGVVQSREDYCKTQIKRSRQKFRFCKVSMSGVLRWRELINKDYGKNLEGPILCLGTRNGREVDLFREAFFGNPMRRSLIKLLERRRYGFSSRYSFIESLGRSNVNNIDESSVVGAEINPDSSRRDTYVGSFDELPLEWTNKFKIVFSNSFDHSHDPYRTAKEWSRVISPGGYFIINYSGESAKPSLTDPVGDICLEDVTNLFTGELIYFTKFGFNYKEAIIKRSFHEGF